MSSKKNQKNEPQSTPRNTRQAKPLEAADLKPVSGGFVPNEQPVKIPTIGTIKIKLRDSDLTADGGTEIS